SAALHALGGVVALDVVSANTGRVAAGEHHRTPPHHSSTSPRRQYADRTRSARSRAGLLRFIPSTSHVQPLHVPLKANRIDVIRPTAARHLDGRPERELARPQSHAKELRIDAHPGGGFGDGDADAGITTHLLPHPSDEPGTRSG